MPTKSISKCLIVKDLFGYCSDKAWNFFNQPYNFEPPVTRILLLLVDLEYSLFLTQIQYPSYFPGLSRALK